MGDCEEFKVVTRRKKSGGRSVLRKGNTASRGVGVGWPPNESEDELGVDTERIIRMLHDAEIDVRDCSFTENLFDRLSGALEALNVGSVSEILCYGLGRFSQHKSSKYQLALLLSLKRHFGTAAYIYDPAFFTKEVQLLERLGFQMIRTNEEGKRTVHEKLTFVYMPHCSTHLINNFLYANWGRGLSNCILLTNSFSALTENPRCNSMDEWVNYVFLIQPYVTEITLRNNFSHQEAFNDFSIHVFLARDIDRVPQDYWNLKKEPIYRNMQVEFVRAEQTEGP